jgi:hypothetical protein
LATGLYLERPLPLVFPTPLNRSHKDLPPMRGILLWLIGIPIPIIILLYIFHVL